MFHFGCLVRSKRYRGLRGLICSPRRGRWQNHPKPASLPWTLLLPASLPLFSSSLSLRSVPPPFSPPLPSPPIPSPPRCMWWCCALGGRSSSSEPKNTSSFGTSELRRVCFLCLDQRCGLTAAQAQSLSLSLSLSLLPGGTTGCYIGGSSVFTPTKPKLIPPLLPPQPPWSTLGWTVGGLPAWRVFLVGVSAEVSSGVEWMFSSTSKKGGAPDELS